MTDHGFTGTQQGLTLPQLDALTLHLVATINPGDIFSHGDCVGADEQAHMIARVCGAVTHIFPPVIDAKRARCDGDVIWLPRPYLVRNHDIVRRSQRMTACPRGPEELRSGTWATIRFARQVGKPLTIIWPDGSLGS